MMATRVPIGRGDVAATSSGGLAGRKGVALKSNMFDIFQVSSRSRRRRGDVAATKCILNEAETSLRPAGDQGDRGKVASTSPPLCGDVSATLQQRICDLEATSSRQRSTYFYRSRKEIINQRKAKTCIYTCKT